MDIGRTEGIGGPGRIEGPQRTPRVTPQGPPTAARADKVALSDHAKLVSEALSLPFVRAERVEEIKKLIESGRFETDERLEGALRKFLEENKDLLE